jgi:PAS domain S-box-containing protein
MRLLGLQLGLTLHSRQAVEVQERSARNLSGLLGMSQAVASLVDLQRVPELVARHARALCEADEATVFLPEEEGSVLRPVVCLGAYAEQVLKVRLKLGEGLTGRVAASRRGEILNHAELDPRVLNIPGTPQEQESILSVPLIAADRLIGVLTLHKLRDRTFDPGDLDTLEIFAAQAAAAMKSARLLEDLREERSRLVTMLQQMEAGVVFAGREGHVILLNAAARKLLRLGEETTRSTLPELLGRAELTGILETLQDMEGTGRRHATSEESIGGRTFICSLTSSRDERGESGGTVLLFKDVTELKEIELQLLQSSKMSAVGQLAAGIAHEFNNLIAAIYGYAQFMKEHPDEKTVQKGVEVILRTSERARGLTSSLLTYSRRRPGRREVIDLNRILRDTLLLLSRQLERSRIDVVTDLQDLPDTVVDAGRIQQVFLDLLLNAQQAMAQGGRLTIRSRVGEDGIEIEIEDTGPGIPAGIQDRIFEPFFTTKGPLGGAKTPGTGLGLSVAYNVLQDHGGAIRVKSEVGHGACFRVSLPVSREKPSPLAGVESLDGGRLCGRILLAEDDPELSGRLVDVLGQLGHEVIVTAGGEGLAETIAEREVHMVLLERRASDHDPLQTYQRIRQTHPGLPVVFFIDRADTEPLEAEGDSWIFRVNKPFRDRDLIALVSRILHRRLAVEDQAA